MTRLLDRKRRSWLAAVTGATVGLVAWAMPATSTAQTPGPPGSSGGFTGLSPARLVDTRTAGGPLCAGQVLDVPVTGINDVPSSGVDSVVLNVTAIAPSQASFLTVFPHGAARPNASNLNFTAQTTIPNLVIAKVGDSGHVSIYNDSGCVDVAADIPGWFAAAVSTPPPPPPPPLPPPPPPPFASTGSSPASQPASTEPSPRDVLLQPGLRCFSTGEVKVSGPQVTEPVAAALVEWFVYAGYWSHESYSFWWWTGSANPSSPVWDLICNGGWVAAYVWVWDYAAQSWADSRWAVNVMSPYGGWDNSYYSCHSYGPPFD